MARVVNVPGGDPIEDAELDLDDLVLDSQDFDDSGFDNCDLVIRDVYTVQGGQQRQGNDGKPYVTSDQAVLLCDIIDEAIPDGGTTSIYLSLPKKGPDGKRKKTRANSKLGLFIEMLSGLGVSSTEGMDFCYRFQQMSDLIGLKLHRTVETREVGNLSMRLDVPTEILGFDHEVRAAASTEKRPLRPIEFTPPQTA